MTAEEYKPFSAALADPPMPKKEAAIAAAAKIERPANMPLRETVILPQPVAAPAKPQATIPAPSAPAIGQAEVEKAEETEEIQQIALPMPEEIPWRLVGELYQSYIIVEQGEEAFLIDKHAAHERILFEKLKANQESFSSQALLQPIAIRLSPAATAELISNQKLLTELGFELEEFGENTLLLRQIPMDLSPEQAAETVETMASDLLSGRRERSDSVRDEILHTVACKAAIKAGWKNDEAELLALVKQVMADENLKYCPHGRPICITLSKKQLEKQFKRA
jgi:DNA mismatch repair protein MutL